MIETEEREFKDVSIISGVRGGSQTYEKMIYDIITSYDHKQLKTKFTQSFQECYKQNAAKYISQMLNGTPVTIIFGISNNGRINGFPIENFDELQIQDITYNAFETICNATSENKQLYSLMRNTLQINIKYTKISFTDSDIRESKLLIEQKITEIEHTKHLAKKYFEEKTRYKKEMQLRWEQVNASMYNVANTFRLEFVYWIKYSKDHAIDKYCSKCINAILNVLDENKTIDIDTKLFKLNVLDVPENKMNDYIIVQLISIYKDILKKMLKTEVMPITRPELIQYPYLCLVRRYYADIVRILSIQYPVYTCSITIDYETIKQFNSIVYGLAPYGFFCYDTNNARVLMRRMLDHSGEPISDVMNVSFEGIPYRKQKRKHKECYN